MWWIAEAPIRTALVFNHQVGIGPGHGGKAQVDADPAVVGLDLAEELIDLFQAIRNDRLDCDAITVITLLQAEVECMAVEVMPLGQVPGYAHLTGADFTHVIGKCLLQG